MQMYHPKKTLFRSSRFWKRSLLGILGGSLVIVACQKDPEITSNGKPKAPLDNISFTVPQGWPAPFYTFAGNPVTKEGFALGRKLFFDPILSRDNSTSCGSCHQPFSAFSHLDHNISHGIEGKVGTRNSPPIFNMAWHTSFFWDGGVNHIENQPINPIENPVEMDDKMSNVISKLQASAEYRMMFKAAFGDEMIDYQRFNRAMALFMCVLVSDQSKYDRVKRGTASFTAQEQSGYALFQSKCGACHKEPLFTDFSFRNNGLAPNAVNDSGRAHITHDAADLYKFKIASLRNLKYTYPYMHDGRFKTLDAVLDHYATGIQSSPTLDPILTGGIALSAQERSDLLAFLNTLNDEVFVSDPRFKETN